MSVDLGIGTQQQHRLGGFASHGGGGPDSPRSRWASPAWTPSDPTTCLLPVLALAYLIFGAARGRLRRPGVLVLQTVGLLGFGALALLALFLDPAVGHYVVAAGWIGHAIWDVAHHRDLNHHRAVGVVPRWYAESCFVLDLLIGVSLLVAPTL